MNMIFREELGEIEVQKSARAQFYCFVSSEAPVSQSKVFFGLVQPISDSNGLVATYGGHQYPCGANKPCFGGGITEQQRDSGAY